MREQFFINISEGKEEKYQFYKNLYNLINNSGLQNKPIFLKKNIKIKKYKINAEKKNFFSDFKSNATLHSKLLKDIKNLNPNKYYLQNYNLKNSLMKKSYSGNNMKSNENLNFLEGVNI